MATLDKITEMQKQGLPDSEISTQLQNEGVSPQEINDSFNQAKIKNAVSEDPTGQPPQQPEMQPSIAHGPQGEVPQAQNTQPMAQEAPAAPQPEMQPPMMQPPVMQAPSPEVYPPQEEQPQDYYQETPQAYSGQEYYPPQEGMSTETISEIAEQVVIEKFNEFTEKTGDIASFKITIQDKVVDIDDRLKRIEGNIDRLQQAIIGKIGEFGESSNLIHKDLDNLHGTVSKLVNPLVDNYEKLKKMAKK